MTDRHLTRQIVRRSADRLNGALSVRDVRISVEHVLRDLADGASWDDLLNAYPDLERDDIRACLDWAASRAGQP